MKGYLLKQTVLNKKTVTRRFYGLKEINSDIDRHSYLHDQVIHGESRRLIASFVNINDGKKIIVKSKYSMYEFVFIGEGIFIHKNDQSIIYDNDIDDALRKVIKASKDYKYVSPLLMSAQQARVQVKITGIKLERINEITEIEAIKEGVNTDNGFYIPDTKFRNISATTVFFDIIKAINPDTPALKENHWCFAYTYELIKPNYNA